MQKLTGKEFYFLKSAAIDRRALLSQNFVTFDNENVKSNVTDKVELIRSDQGKIGLSFYFQIVNQNFISEKILSKSLI